MQVDHDKAQALEELVWLVNTDDPRTGEDHLSTPEALATFIVDRRITGDRTGDARELRAVHRLRTRLREVFDLADRGERDAVVVALNTLISDAQAVPQLVEHDGLPLHLHYTPAQAPLDQRLGAEMAVALAVVVRDGGIERLRVCVTPDCGRVLVDLTKNRSRRYCDTQCANRQHVAAYRKRH